MGKTDKVAYQFLKGENENLRARIAELESDLAAMTSRYSRAAADIASLEAQLAAIDKAREVK